MGLTVYSSSIEFCAINHHGLSHCFDGVKAGSICGVVFCGTTDNMQYHKLLRVLKEEVYKEIGKPVPVTLVPQYRLPDGGLSVTIYTLDCNANIHTEVQDGICYSRIESNEESLLFIEGIAATDFTLSVKQQSAEVFCKLDAILTAHNFTVSDIVRQWNYIGDIVGSRMGKQNYQEFNDYRTEYYSKGDWQNGYPAATGIGASGKGIIVGCIACKAAAIYPIDNPLQVAAHAYSKQVLIDSRADAVKSTPKFERAKVITTSRGACCFVSGTAAIRGEQSVEGCSAAEQTLLTIENIAHLVSKENLVRHHCKPYELKYAHIQVFIKSVEDYDAVRAVVERHYTAVPTVYTTADVCRSELLVEIEGILTSQ